MKNESKYYYLLDSHGNCIADDAVNCLSILNKPKNG